MKEKALRKGKIVFRQGDPGDCMYCIRWGTVSVYLGYGTNNQRKLADLVPGDYFGEMGLIDGAPRSATVVVMETGTVLDRIGEDEFASFLKENPSKVTAIIQQLCHKLRHTTQNYIDACRSVRDVVGQDATEVDASSDYQFGQDERLAKIHDNQAQTLRDA